LEAALDNEIMRKVVTDAFKMLTKREEQVIRMRFGLMDGLDNSHIHEIGA
jgi:DNA-directed RNA polymerase sigma subunit (sigma70/sigma32)